MRLLRKAGLSLAAVALSLGLVGAAAPAAQADTSWGQFVPKVIDPDE